MLIVLDLLAVGSLDRLDDTVRSSVNDAVRVGDDDILDVNSSDFVFD